MKQEHLRTLGEPVGTASLWSPEAVCGSRTPIWSSTSRALSARTQGIHFSSRRCTLSKLLRLIYKTGMPTYYSTIRKHNCHAGWNQHSGMPVTFYPHQQNYRKTQATVRRVLGVNLELIHRKQKSLNADLTQ